PLRHKLAQINSTVGSANTRMRPPQRGFVQVGLSQEKPTISAVGRKRISAAQRAALGKSAGS
ncbi:MAG: hypothetical protein WBR30_01460, partial [Candidatus Sulfotelmatobacter sp.]